MVLWMVPISRRSSERPATRTGPWQWTQGGTDPLSLPGIPAKGDLRGLLPRQIATPPRFPSSTSNAAACLEQHNKGRRHTHSFFSQGSGGSFPSLNSHATPKPLQRPPERQSGTCPRCFWLTKPSRLALFFASSFNLLWFWEAGAKSMQLVHSWASLKIRLLPMCVEGKFLELHGAAPIREPIFTSALLTPSTFAHLRQLKTR